MIKSKEKLEGISIIRTVSMIAIMLYHIGYGHYYLPNIYLQSSVHLFFCISAFLIMYTTETKTANTFLKNRLIRIVPLYVLLTVFTFIASKFISSFSQGDVGIPELIKSILFIPYERSGLKSDSAVRPIVGPGWTLYFDIWFAFIFFIAMKIKHKHRGIIAALICIGVTVLGMLLPQELPIARLLCTGFLLSFVTGIAVFYLWHFFFQNKKNKYLYIWKVSGMLLLILFYCLPMNLLLQITATPLILVCVLVSTHQRPVAKIFTRFADVSFSFYLLHYYVILVVCKFIDFTQLNLKTILGTVVVFCLALIASICSYVIIEKKMGKALQGFLERYFK